MGHHVQANRMALQVNHLAHQVNLMVHLLKDNKEVIQVDLLGLQVVVMALHQVEEARMGN